jgi:hypothetical protein
MESFEPTTEEYTFDPSLIYKQTLYNLVASVLTINTLTAIEILTIVSAM